MTFLETISYSAGGSICLAMAVILIFIKFDSFPVNAAYRRIKLFLAYSALIEVFVDICVLTLLACGESFFVLDAFIVPLSYSLHLYLMTRAIVGLMHNVEKVQFYNLLCFTPLTLITLFYLGGYIYYGLEKGSSIFSLREYVSYNTTPWASICSYLLYGVVFVELAICLYKVWAGTKSYLNKLNNFYSGNEVINGERMIRISYCFFAYFFLAAIDFILSNDTLDSLFMAINTLIFILFVITVCNLQDVYLSTMQLDTFKIDKLKALNRSKFAAVKNENTSLVQTKEVGESEIMKMICDWQARRDKPFLKDSILIADVACELGITEVQLSFVLNHSMQMNFNTWINTLRIEESKQAMKENELLNVSEIASLSGFSDLSTFSKVFKKITRPLQSKIICI